MGIVGQRKLVNREHLEILVPSYRHLGNNRTRLINRSIRKLFDNMCLDKVHEKQDLGKGNSPCIVALDRGGSLLLGLSHKKRIPHKKMSINGKDYITRSIPSVYRHANGVNQVEVDTILFCEKNGFEIVNWEHEKGREFTYNNQQILMIPDSTIKLRMKNKNLNIFLEFDTGTEGIRSKKSFPIILEKVFNYKKYKSSKLWSEDFKNFPLVFLVTEDEHRIPYFNQKCKENGIQGFGIYHENYTKVLQHLASKV
ncbi:replication-relaxation family protein [Bacillus phage vB_BanS-Thrax3]|nr:replication-relaxation family protein [Bacillus phage vB_BanS-Thrax3]